ncbi:MAG: transferase [Deltaproteobacteria bacterium]|nr:transferase [Deltaproteobacteria bacterium]
MKQLEKLSDHIINRVNINLRGFKFDVTPFIKKSVPLSQLVKFYAFYGVTSHHPLYFNFTRSSLAGSYFLGKCKIDRSVLYKSDIRGDELKRKGDLCHSHDSAIPIDEDEVIRIKDSYLIKTLVHNYSHDPENPEEFLIRNTVSLPYANIHGAPMEGCFLGPFSTVDLTTLHGCIIGTFTYVQAGELFHHRIDPGTVWIRSDEFDFNYSFDQEVLDHYISFDPDKGSRGVLMDFVEDRKIDFEGVFDVVHLEASISVPDSSALNRYSVVKGDTHIGENVLVAQRGYLENAWLGTGANVQESSYIINSNLEGNDVTAHGGKIINARLGKKVFVGFNAFLHGKMDYPLVIGEESIIMPHTIIDLEESLEIPSGHMVWGCIRNREDLKKHIVSLKELSQIQGQFTLGSMRFQGSGSSFVQAFQERIEHILEANGAYYDGEKNRGHAQEGQTISYNTIQPYLTGDLKGIYPCIDIKP